MGWPFLCVILIIVIYAGANGIYMAASPLRWASARWTAKGQYGYDAISRDIQAGRGWQWRFAGTLTAIFAVAALLLLISWTLKK